MHWRAQIVYFGSARAGFFSERKYDSCLRQRSCSSVTDRFIYLFYSLSAKRHSGDLITGSRLLWNRKRKFGSCPQFALDPCALSGQWLWWLQMQRHFSSVSIAELSAPAPAPSLITRRVWSWWSSWRACPISSANSHLTLSRPVPSFSSPL